MLLLLVSWHFLQSLRLFSRSVGRSVRNAFVMLSLFEGFEEEPSEDSFDPKIDWLSGWWRPSQPITLYSHSSPRSTRAHPTRYQRSGHAVPTLWLVCRHLAFLSPPRLLRCRSLRLLSSRQPPKSFLYSCVRARHASVQT